MKTLSLEVVHDSSGNKGFTCAARHSGYDKFGYTSLVLLFQSYGDKGSAHDKSSSSKALNLGHNHLSTNLYCC
jgi:hypothetical protein